MTEAQHVADLATAHGYTVAVAESLTGGTLSAELAATQGSSDWFAGGIVAYQTRTKVEVLGVPAGCPVISAQCVTTMASSLADLLGADAVVAVSGAGGPEGQDGQPPGTTWFATLVRGRARTERRHFPGSPEDVLAASRDTALRLLAAEMAE
ncbi:CinA family protein [Corynebacterium sp.]|uniref:CinA family protein n=1 Tax=Corynebacterium sp. TaxID=1720 RepID=UPI0026DF6CDB|nr:CinA family protein [Corynebacterium sp.]MDO5512120.1 CinA family protein [Corynebacterium sp.]